MLEDKWLVWRFKRGSSDALRQIYDKYKNDLLALALALSRDRAAAEDAVHDVFVALAEFADRLELRSSLKNYLASCVANRLRNVRKSRAQQTVRLVDAEIGGSDADLPDRLAISAEQSERIARAVAQLPYAQREVIILHLQGGMKFQAIADSQGLSINTIQSRYRHGLEKLRTVLDGMVEK